MRERLPGLLLKIFVVVFVLFVAAGLWYYMLGRKPKVCLSAAISEKSPEPTSHHIGPREVLLVVGTKATLYDTHTGKEKWVSDLASATPAVSGTPKPAALAAPLGGADGKNDPMRQILGARIERRSKKLAQWSAQLESKRNTLNTPLKIANFKDEEARYQAERDEANAAKSTLDNPAMGVKREVLCVGEAIWVVQGRSVRLLHHANGRLTKEIPLPGNFSQVLQGAGCIYVSTGGDGGGQQITRIRGTDGAANVVALAGTPGDSRNGGASNDRGPTIENQRNTFSAHGTELLQLDTRLVEKKITERQALKRDSAADWEAADKKTSGGGMADAAIIAQAIANDSQREATGGRELIDESSYEVTLRRPFDPGLPASAPIKLQGKPEVFSTASFDLVAAGRSLIAFDHANRKLWETTLAFPVSTSAFIDRMSAAAGSEAGAGSVAQPCLEDEQRLYFFDRGFLSAFDRKSGATLWRLPSVGIHKILLDAGGTFNSGAALYVTTANGSAEALQYAQEATAPGIPLILKIEASSGKILWKAEKYDECFVSGGGVYATLEGRNPNDLVDSVFQGGKGIKARFKIYKLSGRDGQAQWEWFQPRRPLWIEADQRKVTLLFRDELQVVTSLAL